MYYSLGGNECSLRHRRGMQRECLDTFASAWTEITERMKAVHSVYTASSVTSWDLKSWSLAPILRQATPTNNWPHINKLAIAKFLHVKNAKNTCWSLRDAAGMQGTKVGGIKHVTVTFQLNTPYPLFGASDALHLVLWIRGPGLQGYSSPVMQMLRNQFRDYSGGSWRQMMRMMSLH